MAARLVNSHENSIRFSKKWKQLLATNPQTLVDDVLALNIDQLPGSVEFNIAKSLGTSIHQVRIWMDTCEVFKQAVETIKASKSADIFAKMETGEISTTAADRLLYANCGQGFEPPKQAHSLSANFEINKLPTEAVQKLIAIQENLQENQ